MNPHHEQLLAAVAALARGLPEEVADAVAAMTPEELAAALAGDDDDGEG